MKNWIEIELNAQWFSYLTAKTSKQNFSEYLNRKFLKIYRASYRAYLSLKKPSLAM